MVGGISRIALPISPSVAPQPRGRAAIDWGVYGVPETFIVDAQGIVRYKHVGPLTAESYEQSFLPALGTVLAAEQKDTAQR